MCETCGCGKTDDFIIRDPKNLSGNEIENDHEHVHSHDHDHNDGHVHSHSHDHTAHQKKTLNLNLDILSGNNLTAAMNRRFFEGRKTLCLNLVSSPGSGKTTILEKTIESLKSNKKIFVIEGDQQTLIDAERIGRTGVPVLQINTGSGCHLDARMIESALKKIDLETGSLLLIENVGNLVCPALFDLGEHKRIIVISVTEGEDKPLKYPNMFESSHLCLINKSDLLPYVDFRTDVFITNARTINPDLEFVIMSAKTGQGIDLWYEWLLRQSGLFNGH